MTVYIGVDSHARKQMLSYLTTEDGEIQQIELLHEQDDVRVFYAQLRSLDQVVVGFESSGYAAWLEEMLEELGCEIWVGGPTSCYAVLKMNHSIHLWDQTLCALSILKILVTEILQQRILLNTDAVKRRHQSRHKYNHDTEPIRVRHS
jgi:hypothetical protein